MKTIPLTQGKFALVDDADYAALSQFKWCAQRIGRNWYAKRNVRREDGRRATLRLHRALHPEWVEIDHRNGDGLDNRQENLRRATHSQNIMNGRRSANNTSGTTGVLWRNRKWRAYIALQRRQIHLGYFNCKAAAVAARKAAEKKYFGEFARA